MCCHIDQPRPIRFRSGCYSGLRCLWCIAFSPNGTRLASASYDHTAKVWDAASGREVLTLDGHSKVVYDVAFSPDGKRLATASGDKTVKVWDVASGYELLGGHELLTLAGHGDEVYGVAFSRDGQHLASASSDRAPRRSGMRGAGGSW